MKTKRFISTLLALLLICSLPVSAFAATVDDNPAGTTVTEIPAGDMMYSNSGTVTNNDGTVTNNKGAIYWNNGPGIVTTNDGNVIVNVGTVDTNNGTVYTNNSGTVTTNNNTVGNNNGTVTTNNGTVDKNGRIVETNNGYISVNEGEVKTNNGTVNINAGNVRINNTTGIVNNDVGVVFTNYGTVNTLEYDSSVNDWVITETWYGVQVDNDGKTTLEQKKAGEVLDLTQFTKEGYVYAGYTQEYQLLNGVLTKQALTVSDTSYTVTCPNVLTLIWQAIFSPTADDGTGSFGPGSFVSINGNKFLLVAVMEDVYFLASVDSFGEEQLSDLPALLSTLLTEEQLTHVTGEPELLDEELTARFFAGRGSHIVFPCDSSLIFS
ncbi:MAG: hypothetical protein SO441_03160 [Candidatus Limivicinus sp.]|nr:hypothetical protein [Candidatus Limivicinus sp.]